MSTSTNAITTAAIVLGMATELFQTAVETFNRKAGHAVG
jgi:hypothetical protein